jgi:AraC family transcriptional regulator of adaptative response/methylated-DNA-[protein]-cysteine methyltransferase
MVEDYARVEKAILFLEENFREQPSLDEIARRVHLSKYHFQRVFSRWAGISPKRFMQYLTLQHAKALLADSRSVLDAALDTGLSGPGRLHDLFVTVESVTPGEFKRRGEGLTIHFGWHPSPFGECLLAGTERGLCGIAFADHEGRAEAFEELHERWRGAELVESRARTAPLAARVFSPRRAQEGSPLPILLQGTSFQVKVWEALLRIPPGAAASYEDVAAIVGRPRATRAVANAVARNPVAFLIPCHRVIRKAGGFGNYRWGAARKKAMLGWEASALERKSA